MKILFVTLSNIGDVILTLPVLDSLRGAYPEAGITVVVGPRPKETFEDNPHISKLIVYNKRCRLRDKIRLFNELRKEKFDLVVDLRSSFFSLILAKRKTPFFLKAPRQIKHMKDRHLFKISSLVPRPCPSAGKSLCISSEDEEYIEKILRENNIGLKEEIIVISAGARSHTKRWPGERFVELAPLLAKEFGVKVILVGDKDDAVLNQQIARQLKGRVLDLSARTSIGQLACLLRKSKLLIGNDSAVLHLASYLDVPVVAMFGITDEKKYGPWSKGSLAVKKDIYCRPCEKAQCRFGTLECINLIKTEDVLRAVRGVLKSGKASDFLAEPEFKRILIVRTDRIGDVLLSTPVIKVLRDNYPFAYLAMMVSPYAKDIVEGNPYLDKVIVYDKAGREKSWFGSARFIQSLKKQRFDLAVILHPANRAHLAVFLAGIPKRIGYNRKCGFLLTDRIKHTKQLGEKHEAEYNLDLLRSLGIKAADRNLYMPIKKESEERVDELFEREGIEKKDRLIAIHPGASCPSKVWPQERFAQVADKLAEKYGVKILIIAGPNDIANAEVMLSGMRERAVNLAGRTSVSELASVLKRCALFISNDSGPVHIASAVGTPVISIFGRSQKGLSPKRWGPLGEKDKLLHKDVGCIRCLAHNCARQFTCLKAITVEDVLRVAGDLESYASGRLEPEY